jgi:hypothetical protein
VRACELGAAQAIRSLHECGSGGVEALCAGELLAQGGLCVHGGFHLLQVTKLPASEERLSSRAVVGCTCVCQQPGGHEQPARARASACPRRLLCCGGEQAPSSRALCVSEPLAVEANGVCSALELGEDTWCARRRRRVGAAVDRVIDAARDCRGVELIHHAHLPRGRMSSRNGVDG